MPSYKLPYFHITLWAFFTLRSHLKISKFLNSQNSFCLNQHSVLLPPLLGSEGNDFCVISQVWGQLLNFKSQGGDTFREEDDIRQSSRGGGTALSWRIVGISTKCFTLNFKNFACGAILYFSNFFIKGHFLTLSFKAIS